MLKPILVTPPTAAPVTLVEFKVHLAVTHDDDNALLQGHLDAAVAHVDGWAGILGRCLVAQTWRQDFGNWPYGNCLRLPFPDISSISSVKYSDANDVEQTLAASNYALLHDETGGYLRLIDAFASPALYSDRADPVRVQFVAGYSASGGNVPAAIRTAILLLAANWVQNREAATAPLSPLPFGVESMLAPYRFNRL